MADNNQQGYARKGRKKTKYRTPVFEPEHQ